MIDKINKWLPIVTFVAVVVIALVLVGGNKSTGILGSGYATKEDFTDFTNLRIEKNLEVNGTSTISYATTGSVLQQSFSVSTTTTVVQAAITNNHSPMICDAGSLAVYADSVSATTGLAPSFKFVVGTSTTATAYSANILASTTVATNTDSVLSIGSPTWRFLLDSGSSITLSIGDAFTSASSTYYGNWTGKISIHCWILS